MICILSQGVNKSEYEKLEKKIAIINTVFAKVVFGCNTYHKQMGTTPIIYVGDSDPVLNTITNNMTEHKM